MRWLLAGVVAMGACHHDAPPPVPAVVPVPRPQHTCAAAGNTVANVMSREGAAEPTTLLDFSAAVTQSCTDDHWPEDALVCIDAAATHVALQQCAHDHLSADQLERLEAAAAATHHTTAGAPSVTKIDPAIGDHQGGTYVRITGAHFLSDGTAAIARNAKVYFGSRQGLIVRFASDTELIVQAPPGKLGDVVDVLVVFEPGGELRLAHAFRFVQR